MTLGIESINAYTYTGHERSQFLTNGQISEKLFKNHRHLSQVSPSMESHFQMGGISKNKSFVNQLIPLLSQRSQEEQRMGSYQDAI